jgi:hypothetical protein
MARLTKENIGTAMSRFRPKAKKPAGFPEMDLSIYQSKAVHSGELHRGSIDFQKSAQGGTGLPDVELTARLHRDFRLSIPIQVAEWIDIDLHCRQRR